MQEKELEKERLTKLREMNAIQFENIKE